MPFFQIEEENVDKKHRPFQKFEYSELETVWLVFQLDGPFSGGFGTQ